MRLLMSLFNKFAKKAAWLSGHPTAFTMAVILLIVWAASGPMLHYSDTWQLTINTATTIITFLMVFVIQNTQNRDTHAMQIKLDEIIRCLEGAHNALLNLEELEDDELDRVRGHYIELAALAREALRRGEVDTDKPLLNPFLHKPKAPRVKRPKA